MTKHAINAFLATSVTFINEIAALCEQSGADAKEVERGPEDREAHRPPRLSRARARAFAGGTLARDVVLPEGARARHRSADAADGRRRVASNREHRNWARRRLGVAARDR